MTFAPLETFAAHVGRMRRFAELVRLSKTSIADETREEPTRRVLGE